MLDVPGTRGRRHRWLKVAFAVAALVTVVFMVRFTVAWVHWSDPAQRDATLEPWMTPRFVVHSWQIPPEILADELDLARDGSGRRVTLGEIAAARGIPFRDLAAEIEAAIRDHRASE